MVSLRGTKIFEVGLRRRQGFLRNQISQKLGKMRKRVSRIYLLLVTINHSIFFFIAPKMLLREWFLFLYMMYIRTIIRLTVTLLDPYYFYSAFYIVASAKNNIFGTMLFKKYCFGIFGKRMIACFPNFLEICFFFSLDTIFDVLFLIHFRN